MTPAPHRTTSRGGGRAKPAQCPSGHEYSAENSGTRGNGVRYCRLCNRERLAQKRREAGMKERDEMDDGIFSGPLALWVAFIKQAVEDVETLAPTCHHYKTAVALLKGTRIMTEDGVIDSLGYERKPRHGSRRKP
jgi:hypothetical protein